MLEMYYLECLSHLNDFMTCTMRFNIQSEGSISRLRNTVGR